MALEVGGPAWSTSTTAQARAPRRRPPRPTRACGPRGARRCRRRGHRRRPAAAWAPGARRPRATTAPARPGRARRPGDGPPPAGGEVDLGAERPAVGERTRPARRPARTTRRRSPGRPAPPTTCAAWPPSRRPAGRAAVRCSTVVRRPWTFPASGGPPRASRPPPTPLGVGHRHQGIGGGIVVGEPAPTERHRRGRPPAGSGPRSPPTPGGVEVPGPGDPGPLVRGASQASSTVCHPVQRHRWACSARSTGA